MSYELGGEQKGITRCVWGAIALWKVNLIIAPVITAVLGGFIAQCVKCSVDVDGIYDHVRGGRVMRKGTGDAGGDGWW